MDPQQQKFAEEVARIVTESRPEAMFSQTVLLAMISAISAVSLAFIAQAAALLGGYLKMRTIQSQLVQNTAVTVKAQNAAIAAAKTGIDNKATLEDQRSALVDAVKINENMVKSQTAELKSAITDSGAISMPSRDVTRMLGTIKMADGRQFIQVAREFCQGRQSGDGHFLAEFHDKFLPELNNIRRQLDLREESISRIIGEVLQVVVFPAEN